MLAQTVMLSSMVDWLSDGAAWLSSQQFCLQPA
jgi:hypothetical protein